MADQACSGLYSSLVSPSGCGYLHPCRGQDQGQFCVFVCHCEPSSDCLLKFAMFLGFPEFASFSVCEISIHYHQKGGLILPG